MKEQIMAWLQGPRNYTEGVDLYKKFGYNKVLKNSFDRGETNQTRITLEYELGKLVDLNEKQLQEMKRFAVKPIIAPKVAQTTPTIPAASTDVRNIDDVLIELASMFHVSVEDLFDGNGPAMITDEQTAAIEKLRPAYREIPELQKKVIRFRETYPFMNTADCPDELKVMVADMFTAYDTYREAYKLLSPENPEADNLALAKATVESYLDNRDMWAELEYYKENNRLLGKHPLFAKLALKREISEIPDIELPKKLGNARSNVTKNRKKLEAAKVAKNDTDITEYSLLLNEWEMKASLYEAELERRKK